jgi:hypothetical protein
MSRHELVGMLEVFSCSGGHLGEIQVMSSQWAEIRNTVASAISIKVQPADLADPSFSLETTVVVGLDDAVYML